MKYFILCISLALLSACSSEDSSPDSVVKQANGTTAIKKVKDSDFELRLKVEPIEEQDDTFELEAGIRYVGDKANMSISHGNPLFVAALNIDGKQVGDPAAVETVSISTSLKKNEWLNQSISLPTSPAQIKKFYKNDGEIIVNAGFSAEDYDPKQGVFVRLKAEDLER